MRRAALAVVVSGVVLGGSAGPAAAGDRGTKTVSYEGYEITVPSTWPVVRLDHEPARCVRYDQNAVYLGNPGPEQVCPPRLVGRTATVSISASPQFQRSTVIAEPALPGLAGGRQVGQLPALHGAVMLNSPAHLLRVAMRQASNALITATYGSDPGLVTRLLATLHRVPAAVTPAAAVRTVAVRAVRLVPHRDVLRSDQFVITVPPATAGLPPARPAAAPSALPTPRPAWPVATGGAPAAAGGVPPGASGASGVPGATRVPGVSGVPGAPIGPGMPTAPPVTPTAPVVKPKLPPRHQAGLLGFDTCTAPSLRAMRSWRAKYAVAGIYIGGSNMACDYGNLSAGWVRATTSMGWGLLPTYVGPQAPCYGLGDMINGRHAAAQGQAAGRDAAKDAASFGLPAGSPVYYDMEAYNETNRGCVTAVLRFLSAWTRALNTRGYVSGVYSSADSGVLDLQSAAKRATMTEPQAIWFALWDNKASLTGTSVLGARPWAPSQRVKQFAGPRTQKVGGVSLNIDSDLVGGPVAR